MLTKEYKVSEPKVFKKGFSTPEPRFFEEFSTGEILSLEDKVAIERAVRHYRAGKRSSHEKIMKLLDV